jgi:hypothetical protein
VSEETRKEVDRIIALMESEYGPDAALQERLRPVLARILGAKPDANIRKELLCLVTETYANHVRLRHNIATVKDKLRRHLNEAYGRALGIEPPGI